MFFYGVFMVSGGVGGLIVIICLIVVLNNVLGLGDFIEIVKGIVIDFGVVFIFVLLYRLIDNFCVNLNLFYVFYLL